MRKLILTLALMLCCAPALADAMPPEVAVLLEEYYMPAQGTQYAAFTLENGQQAGIAVSEDGWVVGVTYAKGQWQVVLQTSVMEGLRPARLERADDSETVFHLVSADGSIRMTYLCEGDRFRLVGWDIPGYPRVAAQGDTLRYGEGSSAVETVLPGGVTDWPWTCGDLPLTLEQAMARAAIAEQNVAGMFPGYTLRAYTAGNDGRMAEAAYSRLSDGVLMIRRVSFEAGMEPCITDCFPVPLSDALLIRLETEPFDSLISGMHGDTTFLTQDAFDRTLLCLPQDARILDNTVQVNSVVALVEEHGARYLYIWEADGMGYSMRRTQPLPQDASLDIFHAGDGVVQLEWAEQNMSACFARRADGAWLLSWMTQYGPAMDLHISANAFGVWQYVGDDEQLRVGTLQERDLFTVRLEDMTDVRPQLEREGWAVVSNPDAADRLHLRVSPDREARSQGKFYNGTPVRVLGQSGSWTQVQVGFGATARTGWMMTRYLAFGADMDKVDAAFPQLGFRDAYGREDKLNGAFWVAGVFEDGSTGQYILLGWDGTVMYVPQAWLFEGNG